jgi:hypothetical protein
VREVQTIFTTLVLSASAGILAAVIFVLPAEYDIDFTGLGEILGVKGMSGETVSAHSYSSIDMSKDAVEFPLSPFESVEYKYELSAGDALIYEWHAEDEVLFDFHSEEEGTDPEEAVSFVIGRDREGHGTYVAPFSGLHGWYWENRGERAVTVRLQTAGFYRAAFEYGPQGKFRRDLGPAE